MFSNNVYLKLIVSIDNDRSNPIYPIFYLSMIFGSTIIQGDQETDHPSAFHPRVVRYLRVTPALQGLIPCHVRQDFVCRLLVHPHLEGTPQPGSERKDGGIPSAARYGRPDISA